MLFYSENCIITKVIFRLLFFVCVTVWPNCATLRKSNLAFRIITRIAEFLTILRYNLMFSYFSPLHLYCPVFRITLCGPLIKGRECLPALIWYSRHLRAPSTRQPRNGVSLQSRSAGFWSLPEQGSVPMRDDTWLPCHPLQVS